MKTEKLESIEELLRFIKDSSLNFITHYYRGQADYSWDITPSLARNKEISSLLEIENKLLEKFQQYIKENKLEFLIPKVNRYDYSWIILMAAQHYGLPTRPVSYTH